VKILVLGLGNDLYGDDGVGIHAVRMLEKEWTERKHSSEPDREVVFEATTLSGLALLDVIAGYDALLIIDTILKPDPDTGRVRLLDAADIRDVPGPSPHYISVPQTLVLGRSLGLKVPDTVKIVAVEAKDLYRLGEELSEEMRASLSGIVAAAVAALSDFKDTSP
jgi:hydrogenase maturation protease